MQLTKEQLTELLNNYLNEKDLNSLLEVVLEGLMYSERQDFLKQSSDKRDCFVTNVPRKDGERGTQLAKAEGGEKFLAKTEMLTPKSQLFIFNYSFFITLLFVSFIFFLDEKNRSKKNQELCRFN